MSGLAGAPGESAPRGGRAGPQALKGREVPPSPSIWICGDVHLGNFGIYEAEDARLRFDLNDFDEAGIAPCLLDLLRLLAALRAASADTDDGRLGVAGEGKPNDVRLLDVKAARKPAFAVGLHLPGPPGVDDAERTIQAQRLILERPSAPIAAVDLLGDRFTVREVQPCAVRLEASLKYPRKLGRVLGEALARAHMRAARRTSATDAFDKFTHDAAHWSGDVAATGILFADTLHDDWRSYVSAYDKGAFAA
jgi:uncharacterized protein (DUF2252 family)